MSEVKWIKIVTDVFDDEKMYAIETLPDGLTMEVVWFKILCLAGKCNSNGFLSINSKLAYTDEMLAKVFRLDIGVVQRALDVFQRLDMIEMVDNAYMVSNWLKYQSGDKLADIRAKGAERQRRHREKQRALQMLSFSDSVCAYCGGKAETVDHIIPKSKGGSDDISNLVTACKRCNGSKTNKPLADFLNDDLHYERRLDHDLIRSNQKLMNVVGYDDVTLRYVTHVTKNNVTVTQNCSYSISNSLSANNTIESDIDIEIIKDIVDYLNKVCGTKYRYRTNDTQKHIRARLKEGFTKEDFYTVIDAKYKKWGNNPEMKDYLRPQTLFGTKFEGYLNSAEPQYRHESETGAPQQAFAGYQG